MFFQDKKVQSVILLFIEIRQYKLFRMQSLHQLMQEIIQITTEIETSYPELYKYLEETPLTIGESNMQPISTNDLLKYLETLKEQLRHHVETHKAVLNQTK